MVTFTYTNMLPFLGQTVQEGERKIQRVPQKIWDIDNNDKKKTPKHIFDAKKMRNLSLIMFWREVKP